jgi:hypothetical protein
MAELAPLSPIDLRLAITRHFDLEDLRTLCFDLGVDYDNLRGEGKAGKARELVALAERTHCLEALESTVRRLCPELAVTYSYERVQQLQSSILTTSQPDVRDAFIEFTRQVEAYLNRFDLLHEQLGGWKEVHNLLQDLQNNFAPCRSYIFTLGRLGEAARSTQRQREVLFAVEVEWRPCKRTIRKLQGMTASIQELAEKIHAVEELYQVESGPDASELPTPWSLAARIEQALFDDDVVALVEHLSAFGNQVDQLLYLADKALRDVADKIRRLPRPGLYAVRSPQE